MRINHKSKLIAKVIAVLIICSMVLPWNSLLAAGVENRGAEGITVHQDGTSAVIAANGNPIIVEATKYYKIMIYYDYAPLGKLGGEDVPVDLGGNPNVTGSLSEGFELTASSAIIGGAFDQQYIGDTKVTMVGDNYNLALYLVGGGYTSSVATANADVVGNTNITIENSGTAKNTQVYGGGFAKAVSANVAGDAKITLNNGTPSSIHGGGYATATGQANVSGNTQVSLNGGGGASTNVYGGGCGSSAATANVSGTAKIISSDTPTIKNICGGGNNFGNVGESEIQVNSGKITNVYGGGISGSDGKTSVTGNTKIEINGGTITGAVGGGGSAGARATSNIDGKASIIIKGGDFSTFKGSVPNIYGGGSAARGTATVGSTSIKILGGNFAAPAGAAPVDTPIIYGGGIGGNSKVLNDSYIYIEKGNFQRSIAAGGLDTGGETQVLGKTTVEIAGGTIPKLVNGKIGADGTGVLENLYISGGTIHSDETGATAKLSATDPRAVYRTEVRLETLGGTLASNQGIASVTTNKGAYGSGDLYTDKDGKLYMYLPEGVSVTKVVTENGEEYNGSIVSNTSGSLFFGEYSPITDLNLSSKTAYTWQPLKLRTSINPDDATFRTVKWVVKDDGGTKARLEGDVLHAEESGSVTLTATVEKGASLSQSFTKDFTVKVIKGENPLVNGGVTFDLNRFFANGNPILIKEGSKGLNVYYDFGEPGKVDDKDLWIDLNEISGFTPQEGADEETGFAFVKAPSVYGGGKNLNVSSTAVTLLNGEIGKLYGGGIAETLGKTANVSGNVQLNVYDGAIEEVYGGGRAQESGAKAMVHGTATINVEGGNHPKTNIALAGYAETGELNLTDVTNGTMIIKGGYLGGIIDMASVYGCVKEKAVLDIRGGTIDSIIMETKNKAMDKKLYISGGSLIASSGYSPISAKKAVRSAEDTTPVSRTEITVEGESGSLVTQLTQDSGKEFRLKDVKTDSNGKIVVYLPTNSKVTEAVVGGKTYQNNAGIVAGGSGKLVRFVPVTGITGTDNLTIFSGIEVTIPGAVTPSDATNKDILWSVKTAGDAEITIKNNKILPASIGQAVLEATVPMGLGNLDFVQEVPVTVKAKVLEFIVPEKIVALYSGAPKTEEGLGLPKKMFAKTEGKEVKIPVTWDVDQCSYDPENKGYQEFTVNGKLNLDYVINNSELSPDVTIKVVILSTPLKDDASGIIVGGRITTDAKLVVTNIGDDAPAYQKLMLELGDGGHVLGAYELGIIDGTITGDAEIRFPVDIAYDGKAVEILQEASDGSIVRYTKIAKDGYVSIRAKELTTFLVGISGKEKIVVSNGTELRAAIVDVGTKSATIMLSDNISITSGSNIDDTLKIVEGANITFTDDGNPRQLSIYRPNISQCAVQVEPGGKLDFFSSGDKTLTLRIDGDVGTPGETNRHTIDNRGQLSFTGVNIQIPDKYHHSVRSSGQLFMSKCDVTGKDAGDYYQYKGGAFSLTGDTSRTEIDQSTFTGFSRGPAISALGIDSLKLNQTTMSGCGFVDTTVFDGALVVKQANNLEIKDSNFAGNRASNGGAAKIESVANALIEDSSFKTNVASARGGALYFNGDTVAELHNIEIDGCKSQNRNAYFLGGGGIFVEGNARILIRGGKISNCSAAGQGGGIMVLAKGSVTLDDNIEIANNHAPAGGGIHADGDLSDDQTLILKSAWIHHNEATSSEGGGIFLNNNTPFRLDNAIIRQNNVKDDAGQGGGMWICPFGSFDGFAFSGVAVYNNSAKSGSSDVMVLPGHNTRYINISPYMLGGGEQNWMKEDVFVAKQGFPLLPAEDDYYQKRMLEKSAAIELKAAPSNEDIAAAEKSAKIIIEENTAQAKGGGIALNGPTSSGYDKKITIHKTWAGDKNPKQPNEVSVQLYRNGNAFGTPVSLDKSGGWSHSWDNIDANSIWTVEEISKLPEGYLAPVYQGQGTEEITIINTFKDKVVEPVDPAVYKITKSWEGDKNPDQPKSISVQRYKNGVPFGAPIQMEASSNWTYSWEDPELTGKWTVEEISDLPKGYLKPVYIGQETQDITIVNTFKGEELPTETITRKVVKKWEGDTNPNQPTKVKVQLYRDGKPFGWAKTLSKANKWTYAWEGLEVGHRWTVDEIEVPKGYKKSVKVKGSLTTIYNTYKKTAAPIPSVKPSKPSKPSLLGTGDNLQLGLYVLVALGSAMTLTTIVLRRKTKQRR